MASLEWIDIFFRLIPEALLIILAGHAFSRKKLDSRRYILSSIIHALATYVYRLLPISTVMPMVLSAITAIVLLVLINKVMPFKAILSTIACFILSILSEAVNMMVLQLFKDVDVKKVFINSGPLMRNIYGIPSLLLFASIILAYFFITKKREKV